MARLIITDPNDPNRRTQIFEILSSAVTLGRATSNDLVLRDASVSRHHARLAVLAGDAAVVTDLDSLNGISVNGRVVHEQRLADQDRVSVGVYELLFDAAGEPPLDIETGAGVAAEIDRLIAVEDAAVNLSADRVGPSSSKGASPGASIGPRPGARSDSGQRVASEQIRRLERENKLLKLLLEFGKAFSAALTSEAIPERALELAFRMDNVERGFVMLRGEKTGFQPAVVRTKTRGSEKLNAGASGVMLSRHLIERVTTERLPLLIRNLAEDPRFAGSESLRLSGTRSAMCAPLLYQQCLFGIFYVDCLTKPWAFNQDELSIFSVLGAQAAASLENARAHEALSRQALERSALERYLSEPVVEKILAHPDQVRLGGENQTATILFADIRGFTHLTEKMPPSAVVELLNEFFTDMTEVLFANGGTLDKYLGDGLMAVFGAPLARPDDAARAARTAIEMQIALARLNHDGRDRGRPPLEIGIGIATGLITAGNIGSARRMDYTVVGDAVNLGQRLCAGAAGGQILVCESTRRLVDGLLPTERLAPVVVKGKDAAVETYTVLWEPGTPLAEDS
jgi:adenylate cyclase